MSIQWRVYRGARWARATQVNPPHTAGQQVILLWHIFIDLTVHISCFVTIYIIIWANKQLNLIVIRYIWYAIFKV